MSAYIHFNQNHNILIYKIYQCAILSKFLSYHFLEEHNFDLKVRQEIINYASQLTTAEASHLTYFSDQVISVPYFSIVTDFQCQYEMYNKVLRTLYSIKHY